MSSNSGEEKAETENDAESISIEAILAAKKNYFSIENDADAETTGVGGQMKTQEYNTLIVPNLEPKYPSRSSSIFSSSSFLGSSRFFVLMILFVCNTAMYLARINLSVAIVYMYTDDQEFEKSVALSAFYWGGVCKLSDIGWVSSCKIWREENPSLVLLSFHLFLKSLIIITIAIYIYQGASYPSQMALLSGWIPWFERSRALSIISAGESLGTIITLFGGPYIVNMCNCWSGLFYATGIANLVVFVIISLMLFETPEEMKEWGWLSSAEMRFLNSDSARPRRRRTRSRSLLDNGDSQYRDHDTIPYGKFLRSIPYLSTVAIHFCSDWGYLLILCYLPSYWRNVYQVSDSQMAFFSVLPCIGIPIVSIFGATFADWLLSQKVSLLQVRKSMSVLGLGLPALCFHLLSYCKPCRASCPTFWFAVFTMIAGVSFRGFQTGGWASNYLDIGPKYVSHLFSIANSVGAVSGILAPLVTGAIISDGVGNWGVVFNMVAVMYVLGGVVFYIFGKAHVLFD
eukprot:jgi/Bigna1/90873/estExt_fgenesh1_pg.C_810092